MVDIVDVFGLVCLTYLLGYLLYIIYYTLDLFFLNPLVKIAPLTRKEEGIIAFYLPFYKKLNESRKARFNKRVVRFRDRKLIEFHGEVEDRSKITLLLSATAVMLTLGMADFLILSIDRIIIYPSQYYSKITRQDHYGEYNPGLKIIVFSAEHLLEGFKIPNDNINLAVHEFAHAISFNVSNKLYIRSYTFIIGMKKIKKLFVDKSFLKRYNESDYFRSYGKTNIHEFFAVSVENFIETPMEFKQKFPDLFSIIKKMLNLDFYKISK